MKLLLLLLAIGAARAQYVLSLDLSGDWRLSTDDRAEYASRDFDDSTWKTVHLPSGKPWSPGRTGNIQWLRRRVELPEGADRQPLTLTLGVPSTIYELYVNGRRIQTATTLDALQHAEIPRPRTYTIPSDLTFGVRSLVIALPTGHLLLSPTWFLPDTGGQLTLVSDGVIEAEDAKGELFGFERTREMAGKAAQEITDAAIAWGQNDDITVVTVRRSVQ